MTNTATNIHATGDSVVSILPDGITRADWPKTWDEELPVGTQSLGFTDSSGEKIGRTADTADIDANQGPKVRTVSSGGGASFDFTALETNDTVNWLYHAVTPTVDVDGNVYYDVIDESKIVTRTICYDTTDTQDGFVKHVRYVGLATIVPNGTRDYVRGQATMTPFKATFNGGYRQLDDTTVAPV